MKKIVTMMFSLGLLTNVGIAQVNQGTQSGTTQTSSEYNTSGSVNDTYQRRTIESVGKRQPIQYNEQQDVSAQLQQAKENVQIDQQNVKKAELRQEDDEAQLEVDKKAVKKYEAQLEEDRSYLENLEDKVEKKKK